MHEFIFPVAAVAVMLLILVPALSLLSLAVLAWRRTRANSWAEFGSPSTYAWIVLPILAPVAWMTSSALHQSEPARTLAACLVPHNSVAACIDAVALLGTLGLAMIVGVAFGAWRHHPRMTLRPAAAGHPATIRVAGIVASDPQLERLSTMVVEGAPAPVFSIGWWRPRAIIDACFVSGADDATLRATLLHELSHVKRYDSLRVSLARICLAANPLGRWLLPELERWRSAREAGCDAEAVDLGGDRLALAEGLLRAARFRCAAGGTLGLSLLCGHDLAALKLRVALLMAGPSRPRRSLGHFALLLALVACVVVPHIDSVSVLDLFHFEVERLLGLDQ